MANNRPERPQAELDECNRILEEEKEILRNAKEKLEQESAQDQRLSKLIIDKENQIAELVQANNALEEELRLTVNTDEQNVVLGKIHSQLETVKNSEKELEKFSHSVKHATHLGSEATGGVGDVVHGVALSSGSSAFVESLSFSEWLGPPGFLVRAGLSAYEANRIWHEKEATYDRNTRFFAQATNSFLSAGIAAVSVPFFFHVGLLATAAAIAATPVVLAVASAIIYLVQTGRDVYQLQHTSKEIDALTLKMARNLDHEDQKDIDRLKDLKKQQGKYWKQFGADLMMVIGTSLLVGAAVAAVFLTGGLALAGALAIAGAATVGTTAIARMGLLVKSQQQRKQEEAAREVVAHPNELQHSHEDTLGISESLSRTVSETQSNLQNQAARASMSSSSEEKPKQPDSIVNDNKAPGLSSEDTGEDNPKPGL